MDLFEYAREKQKETESPLASRLRPETLEEVVGQQHIIGKDKLLYRAIKAEKFCKKKYGRAGGRAFFMGKCGRREKREKWVRSCDCR